MLKFCAEKKVVGKELPREPRSVTRGQAYWPKKISQGVGEGTSLVWGILSLLYPLNQKERIH